MGMPTLFIQPGAGLSLVTMQEACMNERLQITNNPKVINIIFPVFFITLILM
jgi:hypothetical protein